MLRFLRYLTLTVFALTILSRPAMAVDTSFSVSPDHGIATLTITWTDTVTFSDPSSLWSHAQLSAHNFTDGAYFSQGVTLPSTGIYAHGGTFSLQYGIADPGYWDFGQTNNGLDPASNPWSLGSQDIFVTVTVDNAPPGGPGA